MVIQFEQPEKPMKPQNLTTAVKCTPLVPYPNVKAEHASEFRKNASRRAGFSLIEIMIAILVISMLSGVAFISYGTTRKSAHQLAMQGDVSMINKAIRGYIASGGSLDGITDSADVLAKLKTKPAASQKATIAGISGPFVDLRLELKPATSANPTSLVYVPENSAFKMVDDSSGLVVNVNESLAGIPVATEERHVSLALATQDNWVWDYTNRGVQDRPAASRPLDHRNIPLSSSNPDVMAVTPLSTPQFSLPPSELGPQDLPKILTIAHSNPVGTSEVFFRINNGDWTRYTEGISLPIATSLKIDTYADTMSPDDWSASNLASVAFTLKPGQLTPPTITQATGSFTFDNFPSALTLVNTNTPGISSLEYKIGNSAWMPYTNPVPFAMDLSVPVSARAVPVDSRLWQTSSTASALYQYVPQKLQTPVIATASGTFAYSAFPSALVTQNPNRNGISTVEYKIGSGAWTAYNAAVPLTLDLSVPVSARAVPVDPKFWLVSDTASAVYQYVPQKLLTPVITKASGKYIFSVFPTPAPIQDPNIAGTSKLEYQIGTGAWTSYTSPIVLTPDTKVAVSARAVPVNSRLWFASDSANALYELQSENLLVPVFSKAAGSYPALQYPLTVALTNPNPTGSSTLEYRQLNGTWQAYISPINIAATQLDLTLEARAVTTDAKRWVTSATAQSRYVLTSSTLYPPVITPVGGYYPYAGFPTVATISNPNPAGSSDVYYRFGTSGTFVKYNPAAPPALNRDNYSTTLQTYAKSLLTVQYLDSPQAQAIYESIYFITSTAGNFHDPSSATPTKMVTNMAPPKTGPLFKWGGTSGSGQTQSWMQFDGSPSAKVVPGDWFEIGKLTYYNGTITTGTGADNVKLKFDLNMTKPSATTTHADFTLSLVNTPNTGDANASADYVYIPALAVPFTTTVAGKNFKLDVRFGETTANGFSSVSEFHVIEEKTATGTMYGRITEIVP